MNVDELKQGLEREQQERWYALTPIKGRKQEAELYEIAFGVISAVTKLRKELDEIKKELDNANSNISFLKEMLEEASKKTQPTKGFAVERMEELSAETLKEFKEEQKMKVARSAVALSRSEERRFKAKKL